MHFSEKFLVQEESLNGESIARVGNTRIRATDVKFLTPSNFSNSFVPSLNLTSSKKYAIVTSYINQKQEHLVSDAYFWVEGRKNRLECYIVTLKFFQILMKLSCC